MMRHDSRAFAVSLFFAIVLNMSVGSHTWSDPPADLVITGGHVITVDPQHPTAEALAVQGDRILAVGTAEEMAPLIGPNTRVLTVTGQTVIPGFIEGHGHFVGLGESLRILACSSARTWEELVQQVAAASRNQPPGTWVLGRGWHQDKWQSPPVPAVDGTPTHEALSQAVPAHPVMLAHASGHMCIVNAAAMQLADIDSQTLSPDGGEIIHDATGQPTGVLLENAMQLIGRVRERQAQQRSPAEAQADLLEAIRLAGDECLRNGITSFCDAGTPFAVIQAYGELADAGQLPVRLWVMAGEENSALEASLPRYRTIGRGGHFLTVRSIKRLVDGALGSRGAWLLRPYDDLPSSCGLNTLDLEDLQRTAEIAIANDCQLCVHAIGDRANREVLDLYERTFRAHGDRRDLRWRVEHAQHLDPTDMPRFAEWGVIAAMQAVHATSDGPFVVTRIGPQRAKTGAYAWRSLLDLGVVIANGTDVPVERIDPLVGFRAAVTRQMNNGVAFFPEQCMTRVEALRSYTRDAACAAFEENLKGSLTPGKLADIVVLSQDILQVPEDQLAATRVVHTIVGGQIRYSRKPSDDR
jgi:predicted amidohydrolase YtcJ